MKDLIISDTSDFPSAIEKTPIRTSDLKYKYNCPLCLRYFCDILKCSCCSNYICHSCATELLKSIYKCLK